MSQDNDNRDQILKVLLIRFAVFFFLFLGLGAIGTWLFLHNIVLFWQITGSVILSSIICGFFYWVENK